MEVNWGCYKTVCIIILYSMIIHYGCYVQLGANVSNVSVVVTENNIPPHVSTSTVAVAVAVDTANDNGSGR